VELFLVERVGGVEIPFSFLTDSLKQLHVGRAKNPEENLLPPTRPSGSSASVLFYVKPFSLSKLRLNQNPFWKNTTRLSEAYRRW